MPVDTITRSPGLRPGLRPWLLTVSYSLLGITLPAAVTQFSMLAPEMAAALGVESQTILLADSLRAVCLVAAMFLSGIIHRRLGGFKTISLGLLLQIVPQFLIPMAIHLHSVPLFFVFKALQGFNAVAFPVYLSNISASVSSASVGLATALFNGSFTAGAGFGAWFSGALIPLLDLDWTFYSLGFLNIVLAVPALFCTRAFAPSPQFPEPSGQKVGGGTRGEGVYAAIIRKPVLWFLILALSANTWVAQATTVDLPVYLGFSLVSKARTGGLMLATSLVTVLASILAGAFSDIFARPSQNPLRRRSLVLAAGYVVSAAAALAFALTPPARFGLAAFFCCLMTGGSAWAAGVFWALPSLVFSKKENLGATAFCSGASNLVNPLSPFVTGVVLGSAGYWTAGWLLCGIISLVSMAAALIIPRYKTPG